jgi:TRAP-type C4-dicarboxylate transport system substrate-binding protein
MSPRAGLAVLVLLASVLGGCGRTPDSASDTRRAATTTAAPATPAALRAGGMAPQGSAADDYWQLFRRNLAAASGGVERLVMLTHGELGGDEQIFSDLRRGRIQLSINGAHAISGAVPEFALLGSPYLFGSFDEAQFVARELLESRLGPLLAARDVRLLRLIPMGFHNFHGRQAFRTPADLAGLRVRLPSDPASQRYAAALRLDLASLPASEVVTGLQTGLLDAGATVTLNYLWTGIADQAPHLTLTQHAFLFNAVLANESWWQTLDRATRSAIEAAFPEAAVFVTMMRDAERRDLQAAVAARRVQVHELDASQLAAWRAPAAGVSRQFAGELGPEGVALLGAIETTRAEFARRLATRDRSISPSEK